MVAGVPTLDFAKNSNRGKKYGIPVVIMDGLPLRPDISAVTEACFVEQANHMHGAAPSARPRTNRRPFGPRAPYPNTALWAAPANGAVWDGDIHLDAPQGGRNASGRGGLGGSGWVRPNMMVVRHMVGYDSHLGTTKYRNSKPFKTNGVTTTAFIQLTGSNMKWLPPSGAIYDALVGFDGFVQVTDNFSGLAPSYPMGTDFKVSVGAAAGGNVIRVLDGTAFTVGTTAFLVEADTADHVGRGAHHAEVTAKTLISGTVYDITFSPALPTSASYHGEKAVSAYQSLTALDPIASGGCTMRLVDVSNLRTLQPFTIVGLESSTYFITAINAGTKTITFDPPAPGAIAAGTHIDVEGGRGNVFPVSRAKPAEWPEPEDMFAGLLQ
jgi:hypothetical protein